MIILYISQKLFNFENNIVSVLMKICTHVFHINAVYVCNYANRVVQTRAWIARHFHIRFDIF